MTPEKMRSLKPAEQLSTLRDRIGHHFNSKRFENKWQREVNEAAPAQPNGIGHYVNEVRKDLGFKEHEYISTGEVDPYDIEVWLADHIAEKDNYTKLDKVYEKLLATSVEYVRSKCSLGIEWHDYIVEYIATNMPPEFAKVYKSELISVDSINDDTVTITIRRGFENSDYKSVQKALAPFLAPAPVPYNTKDQIYRDHIAGMSHRAIANKHYPSLLRREPATAITRVKQIIRRTERSQ